MDESIFIIRVAGFDFNQYEMQHLKKWLKAITGKTATVGDLQKYIKQNKITNKTRLLNKLHADFVNLPA